MRAAESEIVASSKRRNPCAGGPAFPAARASLMVRQSGVSGSLIKSAGMATKRKPWARPDGLGRTSFRSRDLRNLRISPELAGSWRKRLVLCVSCHDAVHAGGLLPK